MYQKFRSHSFLLPSHFVIANINLQSFQLAAEFKRSFDLYEGQLKALYLSVLPFLFILIDLLTPKKSAMENSDFLSLKSRL